MEDFCDRIPGQHTGRLSLEHQAMEAADWQRKVDDLQKQLDSANRIIRIKDETISLLEKRCDNLREELDERADTISVLHRTILEKNEAIRNAVKASPAAGESPVISRERARSSCCPPPVAPPYPVPPVLEPSSSARMIWYTKDGVDFRVCPVTGEHIRWTEDLETFFKPWMDLGVMDKVPLVPGEGWEFLPHQSPPENGDEYWYISEESESGWKLSYEKPESYPVHSAPGKPIGPYRRKIKPAPPFKTVPSGTTQTVLADPKTFLVESQQAYPLPKCPKCGSDPFWTTQNDLHRIGCSVCPDFGTSTTKSIKQVAEWWQKMCEPVVGESAPTSPEVPQAHGLTTPATPSAAVGADGPGADPFFEHKRIEFLEDRITQQGRQIAELIDQLDVKDDAISKLSVENARLTKLNHHLREAAVMAIVERVPKTRTVTLWEYSVTTSGTIKRLWSEEPFVRFRSRCYATGRTCECEVPE